MLTDPQTSGGLLIAVPQEKLAGLVADLKQRGTLAQAVIGGDRASPALPDLPLSTMVLRSWNRELSGDLYIVLSVKEHELFERQGEDLFCEIPIKFTLATLGADDRLGFRTGDWIEVLDDAVLHVEPLDVPVDHVVVVERREQRVDHLSSSRSARSATSCSARRRSRQSR